MHKGLSNIPGHPVISNCGTLTEKVSEFLDHQLKQLVKQGNLYINGTGLNIFRPKRNTKKNHNLDCNDKSLIYLLLCKTCDLLPIHFENII